MIGQLQKIFGGNFVLNDSYLGDITDVNLWSNVLTQSVINERSRVCYDHAGDLLAWPTSFTAFLKVQNEEVSIPTECKGFGECEIDRLFPNMHVIYQTPERLLRLFH